MRWRVPSTTPTLHSQRAKPSPSWSRLCPGTRIGSGLARILRILCGKAPCGAGPPRTARPGAAQEGEEVEGATPCFLPLVRHRGGGGGARQNPPPPLPFSGVAPSTVIPGGKAIERCRGQGRSTDRFCPSTPAGQVAGPVLHEPAGTLERVRAPVGCLDLAADLVRQGSLQDFQGTAAQRDPVLAIPLRARGRDAPHTLVAVASRAIEASVMGEGEGSGGG